MSWAALLTLAALAYGLKAIGPVFAGDVRPPPPVQRVLDLVSVPLLAALIAVGTFDGGKRLVADPRLAGLAVAALLVWRRAPFVVVIAAAAATAALLRAV